jgi:hypothetical protein
MGFEMKTLQSPRPKNARAREETIDDVLTRLLQEQRTDMDAMFRAAGLELRTRRHGCKHRPTEGAWLSWAHVCKCLGVRHDALYTATMTGKVRHRIVGQKHEHLQVSTVDLKTNWPEQMAKADL